MDPALRELLEGEADAEIEAIVHVKPGAAVPEEMRVVSRFGDVATCRLPRSAIRETWADECVLSLKAARPFGIDPTELETAADAAEPSKADCRRPDGLGSTGRGVVVGVVDWGFDFAHSNFRREDGTSRAIAFWDQTATGPSPAPYGYGRVYTHGEIDRALITTDPYAALGYHPGDRAHGTHVADIAAGNGRVEGGPIGMAPEVDLLFVHLAARGTTGRANLGDSVTLLEALDWLAREAEGRPLVVNCSIGRHGGPHNGLTLVEQAIDAFVSERPGRCVVQSTGNYYRANAHASGTLRPGERRGLRWHTDRADLTPNELEIWYPGRDRIGVEIVAPGADESIRVPLGAEVPIRADGHEVGWAYHRAHDPTNGDHHVDLFLYPDAVAGEWTVTLIGEDMVDGRYHAWVERDPGCPACQSRLDPDDADPRSTIGTIANGFRSIAVGAYDAHSSDRRLAPFSSSGPTRDGRIKPDLVAPGVAVLAARSASRELGSGTPRLTRYSGTSMAAPHVTGTVALLFEIVGGALPIQETRRLLLASAQPDRTRRDDANRTGSGYLDAAAAVEAVRRWAETKQVPSAVTRPPTVAALPALGPAAVAAAEPEAEIMGHEWRPNDCTCWGSDAAAATPLKRKPKGIERTEPEASTDATPEPIELSGGAGLGTTANGVSAARLFDMVTLSDALRRRVVADFEVVGLPGQRPSKSARAGDVLVERALGEGGLGVAVLLTSSRSWSAAELASAGRTPPGVLSGAYFETGPGGPVRRGGPRLVFDADGRLPLNRLLLRPRPASGIAVEAGPDKQLQSTRFRGDPMLHEVLNGRRFLRQGSRGEAVRKVQQALLDLGHSLPQFGVDGKYGGETAGAVRQFQADQRRADPTVLVDGVVGPQTMEKLDVAFAAAAGPAVRERRDVTALSSAELVTLAAAFNELKRRRVYHEFVRDHAASMDNAHRQPAFLPWHRQFILNLESELRSVDPSIALPYWNWAIDPGVDAGGRRSWNASVVALLGGNGSGPNAAVTTGPFAGWTAVDAGGNDTAMPLQRAFGTESWAPRLPTAAEVAAALVVTPYDESPWDDSPSTNGFRNELEGWRGSNSLHNVVHGWVSGSMLPPTSPNDPCFFLHHCFVDKIWADWQAAHPTLSYLPTSRATRPGRSPAWGLSDDVPVFKVGRGGEVTFKPVDTLDLSNLTDHLAASGIWVRYS